MTSAFSRFYSVAFIQIFHNFRKMSGIATPEESQMLKIITTQRRQIHLLMKQNQDILNELKGAYDHCKQHQARIGSVYEGYGAAYVNGYFYGKIDTIMNNMKTPVTDMEDMD